MIKTVLVTGATGFIGEHVIRRLRYEGLKVYGLSRRGGVVEDVSVKALDLANNVQFNAWHSGKTFDGIIHLASEIPDQVTGPSAERSFRTNILAMLNILKLAQRSNCHFVYSSSSSVYGTTLRPDLPLTEEHLPKPDNFYSTSKYVGDIMCEQMSQSNGLSYTTLRISAPYGPGCKRCTVVNIFLHAAIESENLILYGSGARTQDFTYIDDVVEAIWLALCKRAIGIFNIASGAPVSMKTLAKSVLKVVKNTSSQIVHSGKPDPEETYRAIFSIERARELLDWTPKIGLAQGLRNTVNTLERE